MDKIIALLIISIAVAYSCKPREEDIQYEKMLMGKWIVIEKVNGVNDTMFYEFNEDNKGATTYLDERNEMGWEVKRRYLNTLYRRSPSYYIGYDQYNSKGYYKITSITDQKVEVVQLYYQGLETERTFIRP